MRVRMRFGVTRVPFWLTLSVMLCTAPVPALGQDLSFLQTDEAALASFDDLLERAKDSPPDPKFVALFRNAPITPSLRWKLEERFLAQKTLTPTQRAAGALFFFGKPVDDPILWQIREAAHSGVKPELSPDPYMAAITRRVFADPKALKATDDSLKETLSKISGARRWWIARSILDSQTVTWEQLAILNDLLLPNPELGAPSLIWGKKPIVQRVIPAVPVAPEITTPEVVAPAPKAPGRALLMHLLGFETNPADSAGNSTYAAQRSVEVLEYKLRDSLEAYRGKLDATEIQQVQAALERVKSVAGSRDLAALAKARGELERSAKEHLRTVVGLLGAKDYTKLERAALEHGELTQQQGSLLGQIFLGDPSTSADLWVSRGMVLEMIDNTRDHAKDNWGIIQVEPTGVGVLSEELYRLSDEEYVLFEAMLASDFVALYREAGKEGSSVLDAEVLLGVADALSPSGALDAKHEASRPARAAATGVGVGTVTLLSLNLLEAVSSKIVTRIDTVRARGGCAQALSETVVAQRGRPERLVRWIANRGKGGAAPKKVTLARRLGSWALEKGGKWTIYMGAGALGGYGVAHAYEWSWDPKVRGSTYEALLVVRSMLATELVVEISRAEIEAQKQDVNRDELLKAVTALETQLDTLGEFVRRPSQDRAQYEQEHIRFVKEKAREVLERQGILAPGEGLGFDPTPGALAGRLASLKKSLSKK